MKRFFISGVNSSEDAKVEKRVISKDCRNCGSMLLHYVDGIGKPGFSDTYKLLYCEC